MSTLIVYASKYGTTKKCAEMLARRLDGARLHNLDKGYPDLSDVDTVVVGGPIYAGMLRKQVKQFCEQNQQTLLQKQLGIFICCSSPEEFEYYMQRNFPKPLLEHAVAKQNFGGRLPTYNVSFADKMIIKMVSKSRKGPMPSIDEKAIESFAI